MNGETPEESDLRLMHRCLAIAEDGCAVNEYPFAAVVGRRGAFVCEASNMVRRDGDVTRHAEMVALSAAQQKLDTQSLDDCTLYSTIEPCAMCAYAIRESRIGRVIFGLRSPIMGGHSRWNILNDETLSSVMPEVFAPPPKVLAGCLHHEVRRLFRSRHPLAWTVIKSRKIFVEQADGVEPGPINSASDVRQRLTGWARSRILDRFWRA